METIRGKVIVCMMCITLVVAMGSMEADEKECADQMAELVSCMPFVTGAAKLPADDCCVNTKKLKSAKPKCLCVLIKESTDPSMGLSVNTTLALQMPSLCKIDAKISDCPTLLNIPADSADAKIFKMAGADSSSSSSTTPSSSSGHSTTTTSPSSSSTSSDTTKPSTLSASTAPKATISSIFLLVAGLAPISFFLV